MRHALALALLALPQVVVAQGAGVADCIQASIALRERWQWLTRDIARPPDWDEDGRRFHYRKTVEGGYTFVDVARDGHDRRPAFDAVAVSRALSTLRGAPVDPLRLPFDAFDYADGRTAIVARIDDERVRCTLAPAVSADVRPSMFDPTV